MPTSAPILDTWAALSHKRALADNASPGSGLAPMWVRRPDDRRRVTAYTLLQSYLDNVARHFFQTSPERREERREYGDAALLVNQALAALLGEEQSLVVEGADQVGDLDQDASPEDRAAQQAAQAALDRQDWLRDWAAKELFWRHVSTVERNAIGLGDGCYAIGFDHGKGRVRLDPYDPGSYFPVLSAKANPADYPEKVHLAYAFTDDDGREYVRRITYSLGPIRPQTDGRGVPLFDGDSPLLTPGDSVDEVGRIVRRYPWQTPGEDPSTVTCYMTDGTWDLSKTNGAGLANLSAETAVYETTTGPGGQLVFVRDLDLRIDFVPVVHMPNTGDTSEHFGRSLLATVLQVLDDITTTDTDLMAAASTTGSPPLVLHSNPTPGAAAGGASYQERAARGDGYRMNAQTGAVLGPHDLETPGPGMKLDVGAGKAEYLDTSKSLDALLKLGDALLKRLSVNSRLPEEVLGRVSSADAVAGYAMALAFGPMRSLVRDMHQVRDEKYPLLLRFVQRMAMSAFDQGARRNPSGALPPGQVMTGRVQFGSYLPADLAQAVTQVAELLRAKAVSRLTAVGLLIRAGMEIDDAAAEVERIEREDFEGAGQLADATGDVGMAAEYLGRVVTLPEGPPEIVL